MEQFEIEVHKDGDYGNLGYSELEEFNSRGNHIMVEYLFIDNVLVGLHTSTQRIGANPLQELALLLTEPINETYEMWVDVGRLGWEIYGKEVTDFDYGYTISFKDKDEFMNFLTEHPYVLKATQELRCRCLEQRSQGDLSIRMLNLQSI